VLIGNDPASFARARYGRVVSERDPIRDRLRAALVPAMKARDKVTVGAVRSVLGAIDNAEAVEPDPGGATAPPPVGRIAGAVAGLGAAEVARRSLDESEVVAIVEHEIADRRAAAADLRAIGAARAIDRADDLDAEAVVLASFLGHR
jgi:uncharacterized protein YqeY